MADRSRIRYGNSADSPTASPGSGWKHQTPSSRTKHHISAPGHNFRKVTLTKPTYCHHCTDFIWGLAGFLCEVCNFMSHEKCLKHVKTVCSWMASTLVRVPVSHCFSPLGHKKKFCSVCRKQLEESSALRCEVCELHVHVDCSPFSCSDCRQCHHDGHQDHGSIQGTANYKEYGHYIKGSITSTIYKPPRRHEILAAVQPGNDVEVVQIAQNLSSASYLPRPHNTLADTLSQDPREW